MAGRHSLAYQNAWRLSIIFVLFELLATAAVVFLLMMPMANRAAADFAGLMMLSAQTWSELPPATRPAFARELKQAHQLVVQEQAPAGEERDVWSGPYLEFLRQQLSERAGHELSFVERAGPEGVWHWVRLPSGDSEVWLGFPPGRVGPQPFLALLLTLLAGVVLAWAAARWLARRSTRPLQRMDAAVAALGRGETPALLAETGPSELATLAHRFNELAGQVRELLEARTTLLAGISHDLRTPLARMRLALEMLERRPEPRWIQRMETDIEDMNALVGELLDLSRGLVREEATQVDLKQLLEELAEPLRQTGSRIEVDVRCGETRTQIGSLRRVLDNLLGNARRYGGDDIRLLAEPVDGGCRIGILDRGPGIPEEQMASVFRPFHRVEGSRSVETGGSGLGLAIVGQLAQANGWQVTLENRDGGGLAAWVMLPAAKAP